MVRSTDCPSKTNRPNKAIVAPNRMIVNLKERVAQVDKLSEVLTERCQLLKNGSRKAETGCRSAEVG